MPSAASESKLGRSACGPGSSDGGEVAAGVQQERKPRCDAECSRTDRSAGEVVGHHLDTCDAAVRRAELLVVDQGRHERDDRWVDQNLARRDHESNHTEVPDRNHLALDQPGEGQHHDPAPRLRDQDHSPTIMAIDQRAAQRGDRHPGQELRGCDRAHEHRRRGQLRREQRQRGETDPVARVGDQRSEEQRPEAGPQRPIRGAHDVSLERCCATFNRVLAPRQATFALPPTGAHGSGSRDQFGHLVRVSLRPSASVAHHRSTFVCGVPQNENCGTTTIRYLAHGSRL